jgi:hypothetical protein
MATSAMPIKSKSSSNMNKRKTERYFSGTVDAADFGPEQYKWHPAQQIVDPSHFPFEPKNPLQQYKTGYAEPRWSYQRIHAAGR